MTAAPNIFEQIKHLDDDGREYWSSRELSSALGYTDYRNFENVIANAKEACKNSSQTISDHFVDVNEMIKRHEGRICMERDQTRACKIMRGFHG